MYKPLSRDGVASVIEGRALVERVPVVLDLWVHPETFGDREEKAREIMLRYTHDVQIVHFGMPDYHKAPEDEPEYRWVNYDDPYEGKTIAHDGKIILPDWDNFDNILSSFPDPHSKHLINRNVSVDGRYKLGVWGGVFSRGIGN